MLGPVQGADEIVINATAREIFDVLEDSQRLMEWTSVKSTTGTREVPGAVRDCEVELDGRKGRVRERCVSSDPPHRIVWEMEHDTFGFSKMVKDFGFSFSLEPLGARSTRVRNESYYSPRNPLAALMNAFMMKRKFRGVRQKWLGNLKRVVEHDVRSRSA